MRKESLSKRLLMNGRSARKDETFRGTGAGSDSQNGSGFCASMAARERTVSITEADRLSIFTVVYACTFCGVFYLTARNSYMREIQWHENALGVWISPDRRLLVYQRLDRASQRLDRCSPLQAAFRASRGYRGTFRTHDTFQG